MVQFATLDAEKLKKAETYLPISRKSRIIDILSAGCIEQVDIRLESDTNNIQPMPPRWQESTLGKRLVMSYVLAGIYLHLIDTEELFGEDPGFTFSIKQFDEFSQIYSQLEGFRRDPDPDVKAAAFSILNDYKDFEKMLNASIYNMLQAKNDMVSRVVMMLTAQTTPEAIQAATEALKEAQEEAQRVAAQHAALVEKGA